MSTPPFIIKTIKRAFNHLPSNDHFKARTALIEMCDMNKEMGEDIE